MATQSDLNCKIPLFARRTVGEKINAALDFLRQNWRTALRLSIYLFLPLALLQSVGTFTLVKATANDSPYYNSVDMGMLFSLLFAIIGMCLSYTVILTLFQYYQGSANGDLSMLTFSDTRQQLWHNFKRIFVASMPIITLIAISSVCMFLLMFVPLLSIVAFIGYAVLAFLLMMVPIYYVLENVSLNDAFRRSFGHGRESWGKLLGLMFAILLVISIIQSVTTIPIMVFMFIVDTLSPDPNSAVTMSLGLDVILYILLIVQAFFSYLLMVLIITTLVFHYGGNARENDDLAIANDIENFANL